MAVILLVTDKDGNTQELQVTGQPIILGRSSSCNLTLDDTMVSGKHCAFKLSQSGKVLLKDLGTTNGTLLNGSRIQDTQIFCEDIVTLGNITIEIDTSKLSPKESKILKRDEKTAQIKFVNLDGCSGTPPKPSEILKKRKAKEEALNNKLTPDKLLKTEETIDETGGHSNTVTHTIAAKSQDYNPRNEAQIDMEASTGATKMIKISRPKKSIGAKNKVARKKRPTIEKKESISDKLKGLFKKD